MYDTLISGATIVDGSGNAPYKANVALFGDSIVFIGKEGITRARTQIDGSGLVLAPGFIDIHTHTDLEALRNNRMAVRIAQGQGFVEEKEDGSFILHRKSRPADGCEEYEKSLFDALFSSGDDVELSSVRLHQAIESSVRPALRRRYAKGERALYDARSQRLQTLAMALTLVYAIAMAFLTAVNDSRFGLFSFFVLAFQMIFSCLVFWSLNRRIPSARQYVMYSFLVILVTGMGMVFLNGICISAGISRALVHAMTVVMSVALSVMCALAAAMKRRSVYAQEILGRILGYRDFLENVEMDRLRTLIDEDPQYFYHNLSYAIVLSLEQEWANKASSIAVEDASWYVGPSPVTSYVFYYALADRFAHEFGSTCLVPERVASSPFHGVSSSHGGFSGFSGGGIGGGGSRSW